MPTDDASYTFRNALTREAIEEELLPGERGRFPAKYAAVLENSSAPLVAAEVAQYRLAAHDVPHAFSALLQASREAITAAALGVGQVGKQALKLWEQVPDGAERACRRDDRRRLRSHDKWCKRFHTS